jgi:acylaminoacyl-peptidase
LTGWLIGHPKYKDLWAVSSLWNPVLNIPFMVMSTDIPDWVYACTYNREIDFTCLTAEEVSLFYSRSPHSVVQNVKTPALFLIGTADLRVPPHQSYYYMHALQQKGVDTKLYNYPDSGHAILPTEHATDANFNIAFWFDKYLKAPFEDK